MKQFIFVCVFLFAMAATAAAQPRIAAGGIFNAASYAATGLPNAGIARGSIFVIFGSNLGPATLQSVGFPLPTTLAGTSVQVTVGGTTVNAIMVYTSAGQVAAILPSNTPLGDGTVTVTFNNERSATAAIRVVASSFGVFTRNQSGSGPAIAQNFVSATDLPLNALTEAARPGQVLILFGTGLGAVTFDETNPAQAQNLNVDVEVYVGGKLARILYKGRSSCCSGLDQINFEVPAGVEGCYVPVVVKIGNAVSNFTTISVASTGKVCSDTNGFSSDELSKLLSGGTFSVGTVSLVRSTVKFSVPPVGPTEIKTDSGGAAFYRYNATNLLQSQGVFTQSSFGACTVFTFMGRSAAVVDPVRPTVLDAGPVINVTGPKGPKQLTKQTSGLYSAQLGGGGIPGFPGGMPDYLDAGAYSADNGSGGSDVGRFTASLNIPTPLVWTNQDSISTVMRPQGVQVTWSGGDPKDFVSIIGSSTLLASPTTPADVGATFICIERVSAGSFTVPPVVLLALPPSSVIQGNPTGSLSIGSTTQNKFTAPGIDLGYIISVVLSSKSVNYQ